MRISLTPRTSEFFTLFGKAGENALEVSRLVERRFREHPNSGITQEQVKKEETEGDAITRELITLLNTQYVTPFDRDDIYLLATEIDDVVDYLEEASDLLGLYGVEMPTRHAVEQCGIIVKACEQLAPRMRQLKGNARRPGGARAVKAHEDEGDRVLRDALAALFRDEGIDPLIVIRWKDIYEGSSARSTRARRRRTSIANILVKS
jgi:uncharacterized protein Yka (UPF0111/DUF47 family)